MSLLLDPRDPVEHKIQDVTFRVRVFTSREFARLLPQMLALKEAIDEPGDTVIAGRMVDKMEKILLMGLMPLDPEAEGTIPPEDLDRIPFDVWPELWAKILEVNSVTEEDRKN